jgi:hypothetical protein
MKKIKTALISVSDKINLKPLLKILTKNKNKEIKKLFQNIDNPLIIHIGGWKKLTDESVDKKIFNNTLSNFFNTKPENIVDFYGITEQLGVVYPDCSEGNKHVPIFADILIRDIHNQTKRITVITTITITIKSEI